MMHRTLSSITNSHSTTATALLSSLEGDETNVSTEECEDYFLDFESDEEDKLENNYKIILDSEDLRLRTLYSLEQIALSFLQQVSSTQIELTFVNRNQVPQRFGSGSHRLMRWPKRKKEGSFRRFACLFRVIDLICEALTTDVPTTKREIFYQDVSLFKSQAVVDELVDDLAATIGVTRADLNVRAAAKGLFCGAGLKIHLKRGDVIHGNAIECALIPATAEISRLEIDGSVSWVLVVEKETIFQTLCQVKFSSNKFCLGAGIIITGKGYPDLATRGLLNYISRSLPASIPIVGLVDADAHGLEILSVYKYGSRKLSHEGIDFVTTKLEWLGVHGSELFKLGIDKDKLIPLTKHDHKKALDMLRRSDAVMPARWRKELSHMLHSRRKAEIEIIMSTRTSSDRTPHASFQDMFQEVDHCKEIPLVRFLVSKLHSWVDFAHATI